MSSSPYVVLGNRSLDKWKVTELKEELKRRRLTTSGLKADLIKRLDEAVRTDWENANQQNDNTSINASRIELSTRQELNNVDLRNSKGFPDNSHLNNWGTSGPQSSTLGQYDVVSKTSQENSHLNITSDGQFYGSIGSSLHVVPQNESNFQNVGTRNQAVDTTVGPDIHFGFGLSQQDVQPFIYEQVPDVGCDLGLHIKSDVVSTESVPISEKNELMFDVMSDDAKLDVDVKHDMVQPTLSGFGADGGESCRVDVEEPPEEKLPLDEISGGTAAAIDSLQKVETGDFDAPEKLGLDQNSSRDASMEEYVLKSREMEYVSNSEGIKDNLEKQLAKQVSLETDGGNIKNDDTLEKVDATPEKLSIDQSSSDDFMEEDAVESKKVEQNANSCDIKETIEKSSVPAEQVEKFVNVRNDDNPFGSKVENSENEPVKRKFTDKEAASNDTGKRQRIYNADDLKISEKHSGADGSSMAPRNLPQPTLRTFSRSDSTVSQEAPKERAVPPSSNSPSNSLRIDNFLRPFTLKAVQELLAKTGTVTNFWMDHIKTHCYVSYSSIEEAVATRDTVYNLQWPPQGGRLLMAEFVDPQEVKTRAETPQSPATPRSTTDPQHQQVPTHYLPPQPSLSNQPSMRECTNLSRNPTQEKEVQKLPEEVDPPILALDDLFRKTKATPRIYYLPLSEEQVATKLKAQGKNNTN